MKPDQSTAPPDHHHLRYEELLQDIQCSAVKAAQTIVIGMPGDLFAGWAMYGINPTLNRQKNRAISKGSAR